MTNGDALGYYAALEVESNAGSETIKQQYRLLAKKWHPDSNHDESAVDRFQKISVAHNVLKDEDSRLRYDILSQAYDTAHFPDMNNLKIYNNRQGYNEVDLRNIRLTQVVGKIFKHTETPISEICDYKEARRLALIVSVKNWLLGWWSLSGIVANIKAISKNYQGILADYRGNFTLLAHNMLAYNQEKRYDEAHASGRLALRYATPYQKQLVEQFMSKIPYQRDYIYPQWKIGGLRGVQLVAPLFFALDLAIAGSSSVVTMEEFKTLWAMNNDINYFQEVRFNGGGRTVDDVVVSKVVSIPVDTEDLSQLYHLKNATAVMYGPDQNFDVLAQLPARTTVRLTGYTPDEKWARIMIDNGEMGFVLHNDIRRGEGNPIPDGSHIYTGIRP